MATATEIQKSVGHLGFDLAYGWEYIQVGNDIGRAPFNACIMTNGRRSARFECPVWQWEQYKAIYKLDLTTA